MTRKFFLISCVSKKRAAAAPARELYVSEWFMKARRLVDASRAPWFILSARHGLLHPDQVIEPYEQTLNTMPIDERRVWAEGVRAQMADLLPLGTNPGIPRIRCVMLAGERYREFLVEELQRRYDVDIPMRGMAIGKQLQWLTAAGETGCA
jgi:hypothetical protein